MFSILTRNSRLLVDILQDARNEYISSQEHCVYIYIGSMGTLTKLSRPQRLACRLAVGGLKSTSTEALNLHADILPTQLRLNLSVFKAGLRLCTLPKSHPLHKINAVPLPNLPHLQDCHHMPQPTSNQQRQHTGTKSPSTSFIGATHEGG